MRKIVNTTKRFDKSLKKLIPKQRDNFYHKLEIFLKDEYDSRLKTHQLKGSRSEEYSFSLNSDMRVIYEKAIIGDKESIVFTFIDIGTHNKIY